MESKPEPDAKRAAWGSHVEFILTLIGFAVGLGNVWRFPYLCFRNGGGAFIIPYFICLVLMGIPLFYMELCFGQFASLGPIKIWIVNPAMKGLGYAMVIVSAMISLYYNVIIAVCIFYFFASMTSSLPWASCGDPDWASCYCRDTTMNQSDPDPWNRTRPDCVDYFSNRTYDVNKTVSPSEDYFNNNVLHLSDNLGDTGQVRWDLALCLLLAWTIVFLVLTKGIKSLGKVVYVTAIFPYILLTVLLVRGVTLDGAKDGISFYLTPDLSKLAKAEVWSDAAVQIFFSLSACSGGLIALASYNDFRNNVLRDSIVVPLINCLTSFYSGFVIFASLGFMAKQKNVPVQSVATGGPGLAFIAYPEAIAQMPVAPLWSILFFIMMMMLGFSSEFSIVETVLTGLIDEFPILKKTKWHTVAFRFCACATGFLLGLPMVTQSGFHLIDIVDNATGGFPLLFVGVFEILAIIYIYGFQMFREDIRMMLGNSSIVHYSLFYFAPMWLVITPLGLLSVIIFRCIQYVPKSTSNGDVYPGWADVIWWLIVLFPVLAIPAWFMGYCCVHGGATGMRKAMQPKPAWGPAKEINRVDRYEVNDAYKRPGTTNTGYNMAEVNHPYSNGDTPAVYQVYDNNGYAANDDHTKM